MGRPLRTLSINPGYEIDEVFSSKNLETIKCFRINIADDSILNLNCPQYACFVFLGNSFFLTAEGNRNTQNKKNVLICDLC